MKAAKPKARKTDAAHPTCIDNGHVVLRFIQRRPDKVPDSATTTDDVANLIMKSLPSAEFVEWEDSKLATWRILEDVVVSVDQRGMVTTVHCTHPVVAFDHYGDLPSQQSFASRTTVFTYNGLVFVKRHRVMVYPLNDPDEVVAGRLRDLWETEPHNIHLTGDFQRTANKLGITLDDKARATKAKRR